VVAKPPKTAGIWPIKFQSEKEFFRKTVKLKNNTKKTHRKNLLLQLSKYNIYEFSIKEVRCLHHVHLTQFPLFNPANSNLSY